MASHFESQIHRFGRSDSSVGALGNWDGVQTDKIILNESEQISESEHGPEFNDLTIRECTGVPQQHF
jgi:hypothetical protein